MDVEGKAAARVLPGIEDVERRALTRAVQSGICGILYAFFIL